MGYQLEKVIEVLRCGEGKPVVDARGISIKQFWVEMKLEGQNYSGPSLVELPVGWSGKATFETSSSPGSFVNKKGTFPFTAFRATRVIRFVPESEVVHEFNPASYYEAKPSAPASSGAAALGLPRSNTAK